MRIDSFLDLWEGYKLGRRDLSLYLVGKWCCNSDCFHFLVQCEVPKRSWNSDYPHLLVQTAIPKREKQ
jgi:hypothetical protein